MVPLISKENPITPTTGPAFSSDISGDGPDIRHPQLQKRHITTLTQGREGLHGQTSYSRAKNTEDQLSETYVDDLIDSIFRKNSIHSLAESNLIELVGDFDGRNWKHNVEEAIKRIIFLIQNSSGGNIHLRKQLESKRKIIEKYLTGDSCTPPSSEDEEENEQGSSYNSTI